MTVVLDLNWVNWQLVLVILLPLNFSMESTVNVLTSLKLVYVKVHISGSKVGFSDQLIFLCLL
jgi:hypothetical protein